MNNNEQQNQNEDLSGAKYVISLIQIDGEQHVRIPWPQHLEELLIGRSTDCDITIDNPKVSREHCTISDLPGDTFLVVDLNSTNGTWYDDGLITEAEIGMENKVQIGNFLLKINDVSWSREEEISAEEDLER